MRLSDLALSPLYIWGTGKEGIAMSRILRANGYAWSFIDDDLIRSRERLTELGMTEVPILPAKGIHVPKDSIVICSPGVSPYHGALGTLREAGTRLTSPFAIWLEEMSKRLVVGITGTKGKSTTSSLATLLLESAGLNVGLGGNIGKPAISFLEERDHDVYVIEVSSHQATFVTSSPTIGVLTSLSPDHLVWHETIEQYYHDKLHLFASMGNRPVFVNHESPEALTHTESCGNRLLYGTGTEISSFGDDINVNGEVMVHRSALTLLGEHNVTNLCGAAAVAHEVLHHPTDTTFADQLISSFAALPHRLKPIGMVKNIVVVDDGLASNPYASIASVTTFHHGPLVIILGGEDRGVAYDALAQTIVDRPAQTTCVFLPGADRLVAAITHAERSDPKTPQVIQFHADSLENALNCAIAHACDAGTVLFSPAMPTPKEEGSYAERGARLKKECERINQRGIRVGRS